METLSAVTFFLGVGGCFVFLSGFLFLFSPETISQAGKQMAKSIVTLDAFMLRHRPMSGIFLLAAGILMLYSFGSAIGAFGTTY
jgi:uncharacterized protein YjeT (DUF2065 family)